MVDRVCRMALRLKVAQMGWRDSPLRTTPYGYHHNSRSADY